MKKIITIFLLIFTIISCSKDENLNPSNPTISDTPVAKQEFDNTNYGFYKGVFVGSSGIVSINVKNNDNILTAKFIIDGNIYNFTSNQSININTPSSINFTSGQNSFTFSVNANGTNPTVTNLSILNHSNANVVVVKERSNLLVRCFEGTYTGSESGIFNSIFYGNQVIGVVKSAQNSFYIANGTVVNNLISIGNVNSGATFSGTLNGNSCTGTWQNTNYNMSGNWSGVRTY